MIQGPVLYILMRNDLASMNPGKAMAQASHASNAFVHRYRSHSSGGPTAKAFDLWENSTDQGFGTVLVLQGEMQDIAISVASLKARGFFADVILDPTYPILDGKIVHHVSINTCGYAFIEDEEQRKRAGSLLDRFNLHV